MTSVGVIAHSRKELGGGLGALRDALEQHGVDRPLWREVPKSKFAPKEVTKLLEDGVDLLFVWGGDGMVQRCVDAIGARAGDPRDPPRGHREPVRLEPRHPARPRGGRAHRVRREASDARRRGRERRAVRGHGGNGCRRADDPRGRRRPEGPARAVRVRHHGRQGRPARARPCTRRGGRPALVQGSGQRRARRQHGRRHRRHRRVPRGPSRRRPAERRGRHRRRAPRLGTRARQDGRRTARHPRRSCRPPPRRRSSSSSTPRCRTSSTAGTAPRRNGSSSGSSRPRSRSASRRGRNDEHGQPGSRNLAADRRRREGNARPRPTARSS